MEPNMTKELETKSLTSEDKKEEPQKKFKPLRNKSKDINNRNQHWRL